MEEKTKQKENEKITPEEASYQKSVFTIETHNVNEDTLYNGMDALTYHNIPKEHWERYKKEHPEKFGIITLKQVFNQIKELISEYLDIPEEHKTIISLWIIGTYFHDKFETYPYLFFNAMRGSGKTRALKLITSLAKNGQLLTSLTEAVLFRTIGTLGIDEFESLASREKQALRELLNASYKKGVKIIRMKKKKTLDGESQVAEEFEPYRPIVMANIWGIEEVLGDRCITIILEKSQCSYFTKLIEDFNLKPEIQQIKCSLCSYNINTKNNYTALEGLKSPNLRYSAKNVVSVVSIKNMIKIWNNYVKSVHSIITTFTTQTTQNYTNYTKNTLTKEEEIFCKAVDETGLNGRHLELYFPLFLIAKEVGEDVFKEILETAKKTIEARKIDEIVESRDVLIYHLASNQESNKFYKIQDLTSIFRLIVGEDDSDWLNSKWVGRALKRLNLIVQKRRTGTGMEVMINVDKAKQKSLMFK